MKLLDTVVIVGALNPDDKRYKRATAYLDALTEDATSFIPLSTLIEFDLLMKARKYADAERRTTWLEISPRIPFRKILSHVYKFRCGQSNVLQVGSESTFIPLPS